ncbi:ataxin-3-like isoform X2 [Neocloeon triangulifer]|uniref:ataxin-3-like isoform X2 n=1 Tax=Neocloeon triangulifer TaxID=2078957 RepID=UPI00286F3853|nr:ataxin-3-like isoform X2 [Neocloeon triangulifer]
METIFFEKQEGSLCAQHCLNALLQGPYFTAVDLATLANNLDEAERQRMAESGVDSDEYRHFIEQPSGNMDDSGFFSVQVLSQALQVWSLDLIPYNSQQPEALLAQGAPQTMQAYVCNYREHWFTLRKIGHQWFNLNSVQSHPSHITETYLSLYLKQLQQEGYSIFIVRGTLPECVADEALLLNPYVPSSSSTNAPRRVRSQSEEEDEELKRVLQMSLEETDIPLVVEGVPVQKSSSGDSDLQRALALSLGADKTEPSPDAGAQQQQQQQPLDPEEVRRKRLAYLDKQKPE